MPKNYSKYDAVKFSTDFYFLKWRISGDDESERFWKNYLIENPEKRADIESAIRIVDSIRINDYRFSDMELAREWDRIDASIQRRGTKRKKILIALAVASCLIFLFSLRSLINLYMPGNTEITSLMTADADADIRLVFGNKASMTFDQNTDITYDRDGNIVVSNLNNNKVLTQKQPAQNHQANRLIVPKGKRSSLILPDGSKVWVNSGSSLEFPTTFARNKREIFVDGEIYIEVSKDAHRPFVVKTSRFDIEVLGTKFNVSAYKGESQDQIALVEGSVKVVDRLGRDAFLKPNELLTISSDGFGKKPVDVYNYISWKDGVFNFSNEPLRNILVRLSRYYNFSVDCAEEISNIPISGKLVLFDDSEMALKSISTIIPVKYKKENNRYVFTKKND
jgi:ferric-dicitrate binding protein FerR (iron transport regulator)